MTFYIILITTGKKFKGWHWAWWCTCLLRTPAPHPAVPAALLGRQQTTAQGFAALPHETQGESFKLKLSWTRSSRLDIRGVNQQIEDLDLFPSHKKVSNFKKQIHWLNISLIKTVMKGKLRYLFSNRCAEVNNNLHGLAVIG